MYGKSQKFLIDNGGELANADFLEMAEQLGIDLETTAAKPAWYNGVVKTQSFLIEDTLDKILADTSINYDTAVARAINAKNSLQNINGYSSYRVVIGGNPQVPSALSDDLPALSSKSTYQIIKDNLQALHRARETFIAFENSVRIQRALTHHIKAIGEIKYLTGDNFYYKRAANRE